MSDQHGRQFDPTQRLVDLVDDAPLTTYPLPASEVRRLGDRRRTRRHTGLAAGTLGLTLLAGTALAVNGDWFGTTGPAQPDWAATPTVTRAPTEPVSTNDAPTSADLPTAQQVFWNVPGDLTPTGPDVNNLAPAPSACMGDPSDLSATTTLVRRFDGGAGLRINETVVVLGFESAADATRAKGIIDGWYVSCVAQLKSAGASHAFVTNAPDALRLGAAGDAVTPSSGTYHAVTYIDSASAPDEGHFEDVVVAQLGDRIVWTTARFDGNENNCMPTAGDGAPQCTVAAQLADVAAVVVP